MISMREILVEIMENLIKAIQSHEIPKVSTEIVEYLAKNEAAEIAASIEKGLAPGVMKLLTSLAKDDPKIGFERLDEGTKTTRQGVYINIMYLEEERKRPQYQLYGASSWGQHGVRNRIMEHGRAVRDPKKQWNIYHYNVLRKEGMQSRFALLAIFAERAPPALVALVVRAEAVMTCLFNSWPNHRPKIQNKSRSWVATS